VLKKTETETSVIETSGEFRKKYKIAQEMLNKLVTRLVAKADFREIINEENKIANAQKV
jgi:hypothetical protein